MVINLASKTEHASHKPLVTSSNLVAATSH